MLKLTAFAKLPNGQTCITLEGDEGERDKLVRDFLVGDLVEAKPKIADPPVKVPEPAKTPAPRAEPKKPALAAVPPPAAANPTPASAVVANDDGEDDDDDDDEDEGDGIPEAIAKATKTKEVVIALRELLGANVTQAAVVEWCTARYAKIPALTMHGSLEAAIERVQRSCMVHSIL